jgi:Ser/Thr protein kinase RdoA (MazF antagonist)
MANLERVLAHLQAKLSGHPPREAERRALRLVPAREGRMAWRDASGGVWRTFGYIEGAHTATVGAAPATARQVAAAFGGFLRALSDLPGAELVETVPGFHDTPARLAKLLELVASDSLGRAGSARDAIDAALEHAPLAGRLTALAEAGTLPRRVTHNDTKLDNVLLDDSTGEALCVIDLDTVMPGLSVTDFGDLVRSAASGQAEDARETDVIEVDAALFAALVRGYLEGAGGVLLPAEIDHLVLASRVITYECALRFLTDDLAGDVYFRTRRPRHNLDRARAQLALLRSLDARAGDLEAIVAAERRGS